MVVMLARRGQALLDALQLSGKVGGGGTAGGVGVVVVVVGIASGRGVVVEHCRKGREEK